jgi:leader peptidase (prepilin peptidase) / N-methyltransferase
MPVWLAPLLIAPFVGSFLGVLIRRLPAGAPVVLARSCCEACGHALGPLELVPIASYAVLRGRCRRCQAAIGSFHPAVELAAFAVAGIAALAPGGDDPPFLWAGCVLGWGLLALAWIDAEHMRLPDALTLPLVLLGLGATWVLDPLALTDHALGATLGYLAFRGISFGYRALRGREGLGRGDACLLAAAGAWLGWQALPVLVLGAAVLALLQAATMLLRARRIDARIALPFGPALALATWLSWLASARQ